MSIKYRIWNKSCKKNNRGNFRSWQSMTESLGFCVLPQKHRTSMKKNLDYKVNERPWYPPKGKVNSLRNLNVLLPPFCKLKKGSGKLQEINLFPPLTGSGAQVKAMNQQCVAWTPWPLRQFWSSYRHAVFASTNCSH